MKNSPGENTDLLLKYFKKNKRELRNLLRYMDRYMPPWRDEDLQYFLDLQKLEKKMLKNKDKKKR